MRTGPAPVLSDNLLHPFRIISLDASASAPAKRMIAELLVYFLPKGIVQGIGIVGTMDPNDGSNPHTPQSSLASLIPFYLSDY